MPDTDALPDIRLKCPDLASIIPGHRFLYRAKVGGERQTITVTASCAPYPRDFGKGRKAMYVTVYGYEGTDVQHIFAWKTEEIRNVWCR